MKMIESFKMAKSRGVPIVVIRTADQYSTAASIYETVSAAAEKGKDPSVVITWDAVRGVRPFHDSDPMAVQAANIVAKKDPESTINFVSALSLAEALPKRGILIAYNGHRQIVSSEPSASAAAIQAVFNLRDLYKKDFRMLVILAPFFIAPPEIEQDIVILDDELPGPEELKALIDQVHASAKQDPPVGEKLERAVDALSGLSAFAAEQVLSMSIFRSGLNMDTLWERKRLMIEQTRGLRVYSGTEKFEDVQGMDNVKARLLARKGARTPVGVVVFMDEIDKAIANVEHDTSGVRMDQLRTLLTEMEDNRWHGMVLVGVPGAGKSMIAKAFGNEVGVPTIALDLGDMEGPHVGESEAMLRTAIKVIKAVGRGNAFFIATSNNASIMRPELQRRFTKGTFFVDVLTPEERRQMWDFYIKRYDIPAQPLPDDDGWTGAEIRNCVEEAWDTKLSLVEAAQFILPVAVGRGEEIEAMRRAAHNKYLSASEPGKYNYTPKAMERVLRAFDLSTDRPN